MRKKNLFKKLIATAGAMVMALTLVMPMGVNAAPINDYPATNAKGSLTITKYESTTGAGEWNTSDGVQSLPSEGATPLGGVTFTILQVGTVSQETYTVDGEQVTGLVYDITDTALQTKLLSLTDDDKAEPVISGTNKYTSTVLDKALKKLYESDQNVADDIVTRDTVKNDAKSQTTLEAEQGDLKKGQAKFADLDQGLYLVAETQSPATVTKKSVPFFVSIPSIVNATEGNSQWEMDVKAYPKNSTSDITIDKKITDVTDNTSNPSQIAQGGKSAQATIGDTITYQVPVTAVIPDGGLKKLGITDTMSKGLTFVMAGATAAATDVDVYTENAVDTSNKVSTDDYTVKTEQGNDGATVLKVYFKGNYINELNAAADTEDSPSFLFVYKAKLNADAVLGQTGNKNEVKLVYDYNHNPKPDTDVETQPEKTIVYTWGIDVTKNGDDGNALQNVVFNLYKDSATGTAMKFAVSGNVYTVSANGNVALTTDASGKIFIKGLESGTYYLKEVKAPQGYVLLKDPIKIEITGNNIDGSATAKVDDKSVTMNPDDTSSIALVPLTVVNNKGFDLPQTGAAGTALFAIVGIVLAAVAGGLLFFMKKSPKRK